MIIEFDEVDSTVQLLKLPNLPSDIVSIAKDPTETTNSPSIFIILTSFLVAAEMNNKLYEKIDCSGFNKTDCKFEFEFVLIFVFDVDNFVLSFKEILCSRFSSSSSTTSSEFDSPQL